MLIMRKHRNAKWDRKSRKCMKETVGDSDKFSGPFVLLTENEMYELKLHCQIGYGTGCGGTFHCNEMQNREHLEPDLGGVGVCTLTGIMSCQLVPVLGVPGSLTPRSSTVEAFLCHFFIQGTFPAQSHLQFPSQGKPESLAPPHFPKTPGRTDSSFPWLLPESHSHSMACLCTVVSRVNPSPFLRQYR